MNRRNYGGLNVGTSLVLVAFVLVSLVTFSGLSLLSANSDSKLSHQNAEHTTEYYAANRVAEIKLANVDKLLTELAKSSSSKEEYLAGIRNALALENNIEVTEDGSISYSVDINDKQQLNVVLKPNYPHIGNYCTYNIVNWNTRVSPDWSSGSNSLKDKLMF